MIIKALLDLIYSVLSLLLVFELPKFPDSIMNVMGQFPQYIGTGLSVLRAFIGGEAMGILGILLGLVLAMNAAYLVYSLVFYVIRKIPMLNVRQ